ELMSRTEMEEEPMTRTYAKITQAKTIQAKITAAGYLLASASVAALSGPAAAQSVLMEEVVVTAQKREQSAQDVGIAITAYSGSQLQALGFTNAQEVTAMAPGVSTLQPNGEANYAIGIRG